MAMGYQMLISLLLLAMGVANAAEVVHRTRSATAPNCWSKS